MTFLIKFTPSENHSDDITSYDTSPILITRHTEIRDLKSILKDRVVVYVNGQKNIEEWMVVEHYKIINQLLSSINKRIAVVDSGAIPYVYADHSDQYNQTQKKWLSIINQYVNINVYQHEYYSDFPFSFMKVVGSNPNHQTVVMSRHIHTICYDRMNHPMYVISSVDQLADLINNIIIEEQK